MHNFYKSSLVFLASIVCVTVHASQSEKEKKKQEQRRLFREALSRDEAPAQSSATSALSSQAEREKERKKKMAAQFADAINRDEEGQKASSERLAEEGSHQKYINTLKDLMSTTVNQSKRMIGGSVQLCDAAIASFKDDINFDKEWELFLSKYKLREHAMLTAIAQCKKDCSDIGAHSPRRDILAAYHQTFATYNTGVMKYLSDSSLLSSLVGLTTVVELVDDFEEESTQEIFKKYTVLNQAIDATVSCLKEEETLMDEFSKKHDFVAAMIKKHNITLSAPYSNSDFE